MSADWIVDGLLRPMDVGVLAGIPKGGKTAAITELAVAVASTHLDSGASWLGYRCSPLDDEEGGFYARVVLYLNLELPADECDARFRSALAARGLTTADVKDSLYVLNLKDDEASWDPTALWNRIFDFSRVPGHGDGYYDLIVVDPVYMLIDGDENSNRDMARFLSQEIGGLRDEYSAAIMFTHHFNKQWRNITDHADRIAGAGTLSRYPEVIATLTPVKKKAGRVALNVTSRRYDCHDVTDRLFRLEGGRFLECEDSAEPEADPDVDQLRIETLAAFDELATSGAVRVQALADKLGRHRASVYERLKRYGFTVTKGVVQRPVGG